MTTFAQSWPCPTAPRKIVIIGAGGIVNDSHLPAYRNAGLPVAGLFDLDDAKASALAARFDVPEVYGDLADATQRTDVIYDVATAPAAYLDVLNALHEGAAVLIQKPLGLDLEAATAIRDLCKERKLTAAVNFQLRFSPMMLAIRDALNSGFFGELIEIEVHLNLLTPWEQFPHLVGNPRVEIVAHSIHYIDLIQSLIGPPTNVFARSYSFPESSLTDTRTSAILEYDAPVRVILSINHHHDFGRSHQSSQIRIEGRKGAAVAKLGVLLDYPKGEPDTLHMGTRGGTLSEVHLQGPWFPDAFGNVMCNLQRFVAEEDDILHTNVDSAWQTMAIVEALYRSADRPAEPVPQAQGTLS